MFPMAGGGLFVFFGVIGVLFVLWLVLAFVPIPLWISALAAGVPVSIFDLIGMRLRKVRPEIVVPALINTHKAGLNLEVAALEAHYLAGGDVIKVVRSLISADKANIPLTFQRACAIDLAGRDVLEAVHTSVNPKVIDAPPQGTIDAVARDGVQLQVRARVTVRTNIERLVGGATEQTIIARVGEGIVSTIGSSDTFKHVLEAPDRISKTVLAKGLDAGSAFEILSIDIVDVNVGRNVGAELQTNQAEADLKVAQAKAETRRALAVAAEQEMKARTQEMHAKVVEAEAQIPLAIAGAFSSGRLGVFDYYSLKNLQADTTMREKIGSGPGEAKK